MKHHFYFLGVDPAPAMEKSADDGALGMGRARPRRSVMVPTKDGGMEARPEGEVLTSSPVDWIFEYVWAYRLRGASAREWSGLIHAKHQQFGLTRITLDPHPHKHYWYTRSAGLGHLLPIATRIDKQTRHPRAASGMC